MGIALGVAMTMLAVSQGSIDFYTLDYKRSAADLYVVTEGGNLIPVLPERPARDDRARPEHAGPGAGLARGGGGRRRDELVDGARARGPA